MVTREELKEAQAKRNEETRHDGPIGHGKKEKGIGEKQVEEIGDDDVSKIDKPGDPCGRFPEEKCSQESAEKDGGEDAVPAEDTIDPHRFQIVQESHGNFILCMAVSGNKTKNGARKR